MTNRRILVIDDSELILAVARVGLQGTPGWEVLTASSGPDGLAQAEAARPDAVLLDLVMPEMDGAVTLRALRDREETRHIPVILMTGRDESMDLPVNGIIAKPFDPSALPRLVAETLGWSG
jgi:CheY-like chemotaxis protein